MIDVDALKQISFIVENDKTSSTYKYVLLKSVIDASQRYDHLIRLENSRAYIPIGLIIERWMFDYFPFVFKGIRQQHSQTFQILNKPIEEAYEEIFHYIEMFYNPKRRHSYLGYLSPNEFEVRYFLESTKNEVLAEN